MKILNRYGCSDSLQKNIVGYNATSWSSTYLHRRVVRRDNNTGALVNTTTLTTIPALRILKCNDSSRCFLFLIFQLLTHCFSAFLRKLTWKTEICSSFFTLLIFHTPHFPHSAFSTLRTPHYALRTPRFPPNRGSPFLYFAERCDK